MEEPPSSTVFTNVTDRLDRILPTILSRCRQFSQRPTPDAALAWLRARAWPTPRRNWRWPAVPR
ncbi:hypothetical protein ACTMU2_31360 [Cupriavidus basilensis]